MKIEAVLFDMGGTIEDIRHDRKSRLAATEELLALLAGEGLALDASAAEVLDSIEGRSREYRTWSETTMREGRPDAIWNDWNLRDFGLPADEVRRVAEKLAYIWETKFYTRSIRPEAAEALRNLKARGYSLGVISNTSCEKQVHDTIQAYGIAELFDCVCLSCVSGIRKPDPRIFREALSIIGYSAENTAYVGDTVSRDISGAKAAGFAAAFQIKSFMTADRDADLPPGSPKADYVIANLLEVEPILDKIHHQHAQEA